MASKSSKRNDADGDAHMTSQDAKGKSGKKRGRKERDDDEDKEEEEHKDEEEQKRSKAQKTKTDSSAPGELKQTTLAVSSSSSSNGNGAAAAAGQQPASTLAPELATNMEPYTKTLEFFYPAEVWYNAHKFLEWRAVKETLGKNTGSMKYHLMDKRLTTPQSIGSTILTHVTQIAAKWGGQWGDWKREPKDGRQSFQNPHVPIKAKRRLTLVRADGSNGRTGALIDAIKALEEKGIRQALKEQVIDFVKVKVAELKEQYEAMKASLPNMAKTEDEYIYERFMKTCVHPIEFIPEEWPEEEEKKPRKERKGNPTLRPDKSMITFKAPVCKGIYKDSKKNGEAKPSLPLTTDKTLIALTEHNKTAKEDERFEYVPQTIMLMGKERKRLPFGKDFFHSGDVGALQFRMDMATYSVDDSKVVKLGVRLIFTGNGFIFNFAKLKNFEADVQERMKHANMDGLVFGDASLDEDKPAGVPAGAFMVDDDEASGHD